MNVRFIFTLGFTLLCVSPALAGTVTRDSPGCTDKDAFNKAMALLASGDFQAYRNYLAEQEEAGVCRTLGSGTSASLDDSTLGGLVCVRPGGESSCYWTNSENFSR